MREKRYASRKFWAMVAVQLLHSVLLVYGHLTGDQYGNLTLVVLGGYFMANVGDKVAQRNTAPHS